MLGSGTIPTEIGLVTTLDDVWLNSNDLNGTIPTQLCALKVDTGLKLLKADCSPTDTTREIPIVCPCCTECCHAETDICLPV